MMTLRPLTLSLLAATLASFASADVVLDWNQTARDVLRNDTTQQNPGMASRTLAMMNLAIYDAVAMMSPTGTMFYDYGAGHSSPGYAASDKAAAAQAAYTVLSTLYTGQQPALDAALASSLSLIPDGPSKNDGIALGSMIGQNALYQRAGDGYDSNSQYQPTNSPGHWQTDPLNPGQQAWGPQWGSMQMFTTPSTTSMMPPPPPALGSQEYADAYNEVKDLGALNSATRTADQTEIADFWAYDRLGMGTPHHLFNEILETIAVQEGNTTKENAELFAKASVAMADAGVLAWNSKFEYDLWRPVTGIREGDNDGNALTVGDPNWTPLGAPGGTGANFTPPFPTYVSGHATFGGALFETLRLFYGTDDIAFTLESDELPGVFRDFSSFSEAMAENGRSRVYLGIHWSYDDTAGQIAGAAIAQELFARQFIALVPEPSTIAMAVTLIGVGFRRRAA
ncbi:PAP2 superfamily protein [Botrimarina colliarenosi]|uniref:PAP2 superfamily protein n=1 Tax=Botrimarina colliarenosi TaxID=2528001 RepID=A0A5C6A0X1_9BACT|nr:phosphatase PAP2 family protein [Botrimarina colliarenosi]TWT93474.1 PAP2 superfamily protein [Botrimarina colliarenosi]